MPELDSPAKKARRPSGLPPYLASLYEMPLLSREQEQHLFRKYNYMKYKAGKYRGELDVAQPKSSLMDEIERLHDQAVATKNEIARANLRLVVSIAKRHVTPDQNFFELVSDGNMSLLRAIEKFDYARGNKFSTYASWAIMKNFARTIPGEFKHRDRFRTSQDELFAAAQEHRGNPLVEESVQHQRRDADRPDHAAARRARAEDYRQPLRSGPRAGAADFEGSRRITGRDEGAGAAIGVSGPGQAAAGGERGEDSHRRAGVIVGSQPDQATQRNKHAGRGAL